MRALIWILGAVASAAGGAYLATRRAKRRLSERFLSALRRGPVVIDHYQPTIVASGLRAAQFHGSVGAQEFGFVGQTDASGTRWTFLLAMGDSEILVDWNPLSGEEEHPLKQAYDFLLRRTAKDDGLSN